MALVGTCFPKEVVTWTRMRKGFLVTLERVSFVSESKSEITIFAMYLWSTKNYYWCRHQPSSL